MNSTLTPTSTSRRRAARLGTRGALLLALLAALIVINVLRAVAYSISLFVVLAALLIIREAPELIWLEKIGNNLLKANTLLIRVFFGQPIRV